MCGEKPERLFGAGDRSWITPACAGKSTGCQNRRQSVQDHPRMCGEKLHADVFCNNCEGSPPHVRGKAGACTHGQARHWDHPRVCGEKVFLSVPATSVLGSPPRMRGKAALFPVGLPIAGITPACAGKSLKRSRSTVPPVAIVPLFPSVCNKPVVSDGSPAGRDAPLFLPAENAVPASPAYNLRSL